VSVLCRCRVSDIGTRLIRGLSVLHRLWPKLIWTLVCILEKKRSWNWFVLFSLFCTSSEILDGLLVKFVVCEAMWCDVCYFNVAYGMESLVNRIQFCNKLIKSAKLSCLLFPNSLSLKSGLWFLAEGSSG